MPAHPETVNDDHLAPTTPSPGGSPPGPAGHPGPRPRRPHRRDGAVALGTAGAVLGLTAAPVALGLPLLLVVAVGTAVLLAVGLVHPVVRPEAGDPRRLLFLLPLGAGVLVRLAALAAAVPSTTWDRPQAQAVRLSLVGVPFVLGGLTVLVARRLPGQRLEILVESALPGAVVAALGWAWATQARAAVARPVADVAVAVLVPALDLVVVGVLARLHRRYPGRGEPETLLLAGFAASALGSAATAVAGLSTLMVPARLPAAAALVGAALTVTGLAHPAGRTEREPAPRRAAGGGRAHLAMVVVTVLVVPPVVTIEVFERPGAGVVGAALAAAVPSLLVVAYLQRLLSDRSRSALDALHDPLTGLPNRTLFHDRITMALLAAERRGEQVGVVALDLNRFKHVNDTLGHAAGDVVLRTVAERIRANVRQVDTIARFGGDEFMVLLPQVGGRDDWEPVIRRVLDAVVEPIDVGGGEVVVGSSAGIALFPGDGTTAEVLMKHADVALYRSKDLGGRRFVRYDRELGDGLRRRMELESAVDRAVARGELELVFQPVHQLRTGFVVGVEAAVRWHHPRLGVVEAAELVPVAEHTGAIVDIGRWALETACRQTARWHQLGHEGLRVTVPVSPRQFDVQLGDVVARILRRSGVDPSCVDLALAESLAAHATAETVAALEELRGMGVRCTIDDFGRGASGLDALVRLPVTTLKVGGAFVGLLTESAHDRSVVRAVVALAHSLDLRVTAGGVERREQLDMLRGLGCDDALGGVFGPPGSAEQVTELLARERTARPLDALVRAARGAGLPTAPPAAPAPGTRRDLARS